MSTYTGNLYDACDDLGLGFARVTYDLEYTVDQNRHVDVSGVTIGTVLPADICGGLPLALTEAGLAAVKTWVEKRLPHEWNGIEAEILDEHDEYAAADIDAFDDDHDAYRSCGWGCDEDYRSCLGDEE